MRRPIAAAGLLAALLAAANCGGTTSPAAAPTGAAATTARAAFPVTVTGANGPVTLAAPPKRIVSLSPTATEMLYAVGAGSQVAAVDDQSSYPPTAPRTNLSGYRPNAEAIAARNPDLVVASDDTNKLVASLGRLKIPVLVEPAAARIDDSYKQIEQLATVTGHPAEGRAVTGTMRRAIADVVTRYRRADGLTYYYELDSTLYTAASSTFIGSLLGQLGLVNVADKAAAKSGPYPKLSAEYLISADPKLILLADTKCCGQSAATVAKRPNWSRMSAVRTGSIVRLDDDVASRWGPRVVDLLRAVAAALPRSG